MPDNRCPNCGNPVGLNATRCGFCGNDLPQITGKPWVSYVYQKISHVRIEKKDDVKLLTCPFCSSKSLFKAPTVSYYECLNRRCQAFGYPAKYAKNIEVEGETIYIFQLNRKQLSRPNENGEM